MMKINNARGYVMHERSEYNGFIADHELKTPFKMKTPFKSCHAI